MGNLLKKLSFLCLKSCHICDETHINNNNNNDKIIIMNNNPNLYYNNILIYPSALSDVIMSL